jgi:hypothetical protein
MDLHDDDGHDAHAMDENTPRNGDRGYVSRRKPGSYGDTTRQGAFSARGSRHHRGSP